MCLSVSRLKRLERLSGFLYEYFLFLGQVMYELDFFNFHFLPIKNVKWRPQRFLIQSQFCGLTEVKLKTQQDFASSKFYVQKDCLLQFFSVSLTVSSKNGHKLQIY